MGDNETDHTQLRRLKTIRDIKSAAAGDHAGARYSPTGKIIHGRHLPRLDDGDLARRFQLVLQDKGKKEDFALVEAALHAHKTMTHRKYLLRKKQLLKNAIKNAREPDEISAIKHELHQFMAKGFSGVLSDG